MNLNLNFATDFAMTFRSSLASLLLVPVSLVAPMSGCATPPAASSATSSAASSTASTTGGDQEKTAMGMTEVVYVDTERDRTLRCEIYYPAALGAEVTVETQAVVFNVAVARDAALLPSKTRRPLIVMSHGSGGTHVDLHWLARSLVEKGYILIAPVHPGSTFGDRDPVHTLEVWERPRDLQVVLDNILSDAKWGQVVDDKRIGAMGYSLGGYSVLALAGARYDFKRGRAHCASKERDPTCGYSDGVDKSHIDYKSSGGSFADDRIGAILAFAPAVRPSIDPLTFTSDRPIHIVGAQLDALTPLSVHAAPWAQGFRAAGAQVELTVLDDADHYVFLPECNFTGQVAAALGFAEACLDVTGADRHRVHEKLIPVGVDFFERTLGVR